jgi:hypothetical protein
VIVRTTKLTMKIIMLVLGLLTLNINSSSLQYKEQTNRLEKKIIKLSVTSNSLSIFCKEGVYYLNIPSDYSVRSSNYIRFLFGHSEFSLTGVRYKIRNFVLTKKQFEKLAYYLVGTDGFNFIVNGSEFIEVEIYNQLSNHSIRSFMKKCSLKN